MWDIIIYFNYHINILFYNYNIGATGLISGYFGGGIGPVHVSNLQCAGNESQLLDCQYMDNPSCTHFEDAGIRCSGNIEFFIYFLQCLSH